MAQEWKHLDADGKPLEGKVLYQHEAHTGTVEWRPIHGWVFVTEHSSWPLYYQQRKNLVLIYPRVRRVKE